MSNFNRDLFDEVVHYIAWRTRDDARFGRVKLAKTLFYADFTAYEDDGVPLTGARYFHWPRGPFTTEIYDAERRLVRRGVAQLKEPEFEGDEAKLLADSFTPEFTHTWHRMYLDIKIRQVAETGAARTVSDTSHEHPGWLLTGPKQEIPYYSVYVGQPTDADVVAAREEARARGWI